MSEKKCRWGIIGTASIARKNWEAIKNAGHVVTAVASRSVERASQYIAENQAVCPYAEVPAACGNYQEIIDRDDVDAVYIPLPTGLRQEYVIAAAKAGKHVMCEKPVGVNVAAVEEMLAACRDNNVQFMDGLMFQHSSRMQRMREVIDAGTLGDLRRIQAHFSFCAPQEFIDGNIRVSSELEPQGCVGDLGWYTIRFILWTMNFELPHTVFGRQLASHGREDSPSQVPMEFSGEMLFDNGVSAGFYNSFRTEHCQLASITGSKGYLRVDDFVLPFYGSQSEFEVFNSIYEVRDCQVNMLRGSQRISATEHSNNAPGSQETNLFGEFSRLALSGQPDHKWGEISLKTQQVMDACLESARNSNQPVNLG